MAEVSVCIDMRYAYVHVDGQQVVKTTPAGFEMVVAVLKYIEHKYNLLIGRNTADRSILDCRSDENRTVLIHGRQLKTGFPWALEVTTSEIISTISDVLDQIVQQLVLSLAVKLKGLEYYDPENRRLLPNTLETDQVILTGDYKDVLELQKRLEAAFGVPVIVEK